MTKTPEFIKERTVVSHTGCWVWQLTRERPPLHPYGRCYFGKKYKMAHKVSWEAFNGPVPDGLCVLHKCDNPPCCNPEHLFLGTVADNNHDRFIKGRSASGDRNGARTKPESRKRGQEHWTNKNRELVPRGETHGMAKLSYEKAAVIIAERKEGATITALSRRHGVGTSTIHRTISGKTWSKA